jgi:transposase
MYIDTCNYKLKGKSYRRILIRHGYRDEQGRSRKKTIANISELPDSAIEALRIALRSGKDLSALDTIAEKSVVQGKQVGAVYVLKEIARQTGILEALGDSYQAKSVLLLIFARLIGQGSRLSAVRLANLHALCEILEMPACTEDDLYNALGWLYDNKTDIESKLFSQYRSQQLFLYDVSSSYFEGSQNELAAFGYNRDKKKGKKQLVYGVLTTEQGVPVSITGFPGNTSDTKTVARQINTLKKQLQCEAITFVGDTGMVKTAQKEALEDVGYTYITSITKPQIQTLIKRGVIQLGLFEDTLCEVTDTEQGLRYILRRNPQRAEQMKEQRVSKQNSILEKIQKSNKYLEEHAKASVVVQAGKIQDFLNRMKMKSYTTLEIDEKHRLLSLSIDEKALHEESKFDGCYAIETNLPSSVADKELIHQRYKGLQQVEREFRTQKTGFLEVRPVYLRNKERTLGHLMVTMLAYRIELALREAWKEEDITVEEGITSLGGLHTLHIAIAGRTIVRIPTPNEMNRTLLQKIGGTLPQIFPYTEIPVATKRKLKKSRKA